MRSLSSSPTLDGSLGRSSCFPCRTSTRRCDRLLPACRLCRRKGVQCRYPQRRGQVAPSPPDTDLSLGTNQSQPSGAEDASPAHLLTLGPSDSNGAAPIRTSVARRAPPAVSSVTSAGPAAETNAAIRFLAPNLFRELRLSITVPAWEVPHQVAVHLGDRQQVHRDTTTFIRQTRKLMPIVNCKRYLATVLNPLLYPPRRAIALLGLCMKLTCIPMTDERRREERSSLYLLSKELYTEAERTGDVTISLLQAGVFIALYEMGEAIYPAAYLTVGTLARSATVIGIDRINKERLGSDALDSQTIRPSWVDVEEMRRVWWGIMILDRILHMSQPEWRLATANSEFDDFIPVDDDKFENATSTPADATTISQAFNHKTGSFARMCQAMHLISRALALNRSSGLGSTDEAAQISRTLEALVRANECEVTIGKLAFCSQSTVSYLGVLLLQQHFWKQKIDPVGTQLPQQDAQYIFPETFSALDTLDRISKALRYHYAAGEPSPKGVTCTLFFLDLVYRGILTLVLMGEALPPEESQDKIESLKWLLHYVGGRWHIAAVYESILQAMDTVQTAAAVV